MSAAHIPTQPPANWDAACSCGTLMRDSARRTAAEALVSHMVRDGEPMSGMTDAERAALHDAMSPWAKAMPNNWRDPSRSRDGIWTVLDRAVNKILADREVSR